MEAFESGGYKGRISIDYFHKRESIFAATDIVLDAMNITIDKKPTLEALKLSEQNLRSYATKLRSLPPARPDDESLEPMAEIYDQHADFIATLINQIETHGKSESDAKKPN